MMVRLHGVRVLILSILIWPAVAAFVLVASPRTTPDSAAATRAAVPLSFPPRQESCIRSRTIDRSQRHNNKFVRPTTTVRFISAQDLLYQDQQEANARRAAVEETLVGQNIPPLEAPVDLLQAVARIASGNGFGGNADHGTGTDANRSNRKKNKPKRQNSTGNNSRRTLIAIEQAKILARDGVIRIDRALSPDLADAVRDHVLRQQKIANEATAQNVHVSREYYGVENRRRHRCDLLLSLVVPPEEQEQQEILDNKISSSNTTTTTPIIPQVLKELLGQDGTLRPIYEQLVTLQGEFYEFAAVITDPGSDRQQIHPDLPFRYDAPLYVTFLALQDVTESMGPTTFLLGTQSEEARLKFDDLSQRDGLLATATSRLALLNKGDAVLFDARLLHCGNANSEVDGATRAMLNFSFRNPKVSGNLGYCGSMRPGYVGVMTLGDVADALLDFDEGNQDPFARYGNGLSVSSSVLEDE